MSYDLANDAENPSGQRLPGISPNGLRRVRKVTLGLTALVVIVLVLWWVRGAYTEWLWFGQLGLASVFTKILFLKTWLFIGATLVAGATLCLNLFLSVRFSQGLSTRNIRVDTSRLIWASIAGGAGLVVLIGSPIFGAVAAGRWETFLLYFNKVSFGVTDPQFGLDVSFYVVTLRMLHFIQGWFMGLLIASIVASLFLYAAVYALRGVKLGVAPRMLKHMAILGALLMVSIAFGHVLDVYELVFSGKGAVFGAAYADIHARIPALWLMTTVAALAALGFGISNYYGGLRLMAGSFSLWFIVVVLANFVYPGLFQRFQVEPDEFTRETPYIERNIESTRTAYGLDKFAQVQFQAKSHLGPQALAEDRPTLDNLRLWDLQPLLDAYNQLQFMELYYIFPNMDSDRYLVDGELRQVLLAAREIDSGNLPDDAQNWVNRKLQYTHGYGVAMSPAMGFSPGEGRPEYLLQDIPIKGDIPLNRPELYYGETPGGFAIVNTTMREVDPEPEFQSYQGEGGVPLKSSWRRFLYAWEFADINIFLSDQVSAESKILYHRRIADRVGAVAPFLRLDPDPYPVLGEDGKLWWLQDAYTATDRYPYSTRTALTGNHLQLNYIRNSVKAVVDAYNGGVHFYVTEPDEPLMKMYRRAFPALFQDLAEMPDDLRRHMRYPLLQFSTQSQMYLRYHVTDPLVFFNQAEQWAIPLETRFGKQGVQVAPVYLLLKLPGAETEEFVLTLPFTLAAQKKNLVGWLAARSDGDNYGQMLSFQMPGNPQVDGPSQVEARIENDQSISQQFTLWEGAGSRVVRGQLLVIPVADTIIYVEPLYLQSEVLAFPELKKVILADAGNVVMADSMQEGLDKLWGPISVNERVTVPALDQNSGPAFDDQSGSQPDSEPDDQTKGEGGLAQGLEELERIDDAVTGLGEALDDLQEALERLRETIGGASQ